MQQRDPDEVPGDLQSKSRAGAHPRAPDVLPANRHDGDLVAATAGKVDELDVEHDGGHELASEEVLRGVARERLEPALGVLDVADDPDRREEVEHGAQGSA